MELKEITIDDDFQKLIPKLSDSEYQLLEKNIIDEGCRDALVLWDCTLIDGHNRYKICQEHDIEYQTTAKEFDSREHAEAWIIGNQLGRRNLTLEQRNYLIGKKYKREKQAHGGDRKSKGQNVPLKSTDELCIGRKLDYFSREARDGWETYGIKDKRFNRQPEGDLRLFGVQPIQDEEI